MEKEWEALSSDERSEEMFKSWITPKDVNFENGEAKKAYEERAKRIKDTIQLKVPDRIPFWFMDAGFFPCKHVGITFEKAMYDPEACSEANKRAFLDFEPDMFFSPFDSLHISGQAYEALGTMNMKWPGHGVPVNACFQYVEGEYMKADEYDAFLNDMGDYVIRTYLPRIFKTLEPFAKLPPIGALGIALPGISAVFTQPALQSAFMSIQKAGVESMKWKMAEAAFIKDMNGKGFPVLTGGATLAPFDLIADFFRGTRGAMLDMFRNKEKLLEATEKVYPMLVGSAIAMAKMSGNPGVFMPLHKGADGFMNSQQFEEFYWPGLKKLILALIEEGLTPMPFFEGVYTSRLEYLAELPKGKVLGIFDNTDIHKAKEILGDSMCITGLMPVSLF
ncbi:MAG: uroporphyrinogen decarboxylase [Deltaproteobacteria bacterium]|nr:uroporphyrinogen decarboxylase [Deltaproteobacteria bacterium]